MALAAEHSSLKHHSCGCLQGLVLLPRLIRFDVQLSPRPGTAPLNHTMPLWVMRCCSGRPNLLHTCLFRLSSQDRSRVERIVRKMTLPARYGVMRSFNLVRMRGSLAPKLLIMRAKLDRRSNHPRATGRSVKLSWKSKCISRQLPTHRRISMLIHPLRVQNDPTSGSTEVDP